MFDGENRISSAPSVGHSESSRGAEGEASETQRALLSARLTEFMHGHALRHARMLGGSQITHLGTVSSASHCQRAKPHPSTEEHTGNLERNRTAVLSLLAHRTLAGFSPLVLVLVLVLTLLRTDEQVRKLVGEQRLRVVVQQGLVLLQRLGDAQLPQQAAGSARGLQRDQPSKRIGRQPAAAK
eukprot:3217802-Prymnesium_polylepis.1